MTTPDDPPLIMWGRCRSGIRWFWTAKEFDGGEAFGWEATEPEAARKANAAAVKLAAGRYASIHVLHGVATTKLKAINAAKRAARPAPDTSDAAANGYLYAIESPHFDADDRTWIPARLVRLPITRKTPRRIYYAHPVPAMGHWRAERREMYVDRQQVEEHGSANARSSDYGAVFADPPELEPEPQYQTGRRAPSSFETSRKGGALPDLKQLKAAMAAAHPDRGGSSAKFIKAHERYVAAKRMASAR